MVNNQLKNYLSLSVALYSCYSILFSESLINCYHVVPIYCAIDLFFKNKIDIIIHHLAVLQLYFTVQYFAIPEYVLDLVLPTILLSEVSTIFLNLDYLIKEKVLLTLNKVLFIMTFIYFRIINFYLLINNESHYTMFVRYCNNDLTTYILAFSGLYILYGLNIYWICIVIKRMVKQFIEVDESQTNLRLEMTLKYTYFYNIIIALIKYKDILRYPVYLYDIIGIIYLSITSYRFHRNCYNNLINGNFNLIDNTDNLNYYINDIYGIHVRSLLCMLTGFFRGKISLLVFTIALCNQIIVYNLSVYRLVIGKFKLEKIMYQDNNWTKNFIRNSIFYIIIVNSLFLVSGSNNYKNIINNLIFLYLFVLFNIIKPLFPMTHFANHLLFYIQTALLVSINIE